MRSAKRLASARSLPCTARNSFACRSAMTLPEPDNRPLGPSTSEANSHDECVVSTFTGRDRFCSVRMCHSWCGTLPIQSLICLLYTSDAADEEDSVDLGGRRI